jgi:hypothetical protein
LALKPRNKNNVENQGLLSIFSGEIYIRKKFLLGVLVTLIVMIIVIAGVGYHGASGTTANVPRYAVITSVEGSVMIQAAGEAIALPAQENMEVKAGDLIITGAASGAVVLFDDGSLSRIDANSRIEIEVMHREGADGPDVTGIKNSLGAIWNNVKDVIKRNSRFEVNTPQAVAGVRGTLFVAKTAGNGETLFRVYEGMIGVSSYDPDDEFIIAAFQQAVFSPGISAPTGPEPIDFSTVDNFELLCLMEDSLHVFVALLELAAELGEIEFLERVQDLLSSEKAANILGANLAYVQELLADLLQAVDEPDPEAEPESEPVPEPETDPEPDTALPEDDFTLPVMDYSFPVPAPDPGPTPEPEPDPEPDPDPDPDPEPGPETFTVTINDGDGGSFSGEGGVYEAGIELTLTAEPNPGFYFVEWRENDESFSYYNPLVLTVDRDYELVPVFTNQLAEIEINVGEGASIDVIYFYDGRPEAETVEEANSGELFILPFGTEITLEVVLEEGFYFWDWLDDGEFLSFDNPLRIIIDRDYVLSPRFSDVPPSTD